MLLCLWVFVVRWKKFLYLFKSLSEINWFACAFYSSFLVLVVNVSVFSFSFCWGFFCALHLFWVLSSVLCCLTYLSAINERNVKHWLSMIICMEKCSFSYEHIFLEFFCIKFFRTCNVFLLDNISALGYSLLLSCM